MRLDIYQAETARTAAAQAAKQREQFVLDFLLLDFPKP